MDLEQSKELYNEGRTAMEAGEVARAIELFSASIAASPHFKTLELLGECLLQSGQAQSAIVPLAAATSLNAQIRAPSLLAEAFLALGKTDEARRFAEYVLERDPGNKRAGGVIRRLS